MVVLPALVEPGHGVEVEPFRLSALEYGRLLWGEQGFSLSVSLLGLSIDEGTIIILALADVFFDLLLLLLINVYLLAWLWDKLGWCRWWPSPCGRTVLVEAVCPVVIHVHFTISFPHPFPSVASDLIRACLEVIWCTEFVHVLTDVVVPQVLVGVHSCEQALLRSTHYAAGGILVLTTYCAIARFTFPSRIVTPVSRRLPLFNKVVVGEAERSRLEVALLLLWVKALVVVLARVSLDRVACIAGAIEKLRRILTKAVLMIIIASLFRSLLVRELQLVFWYCLLPLSDVWRYHLRILSSIHIWIIVSAIVRLFVDRITYYSSNAII